MSQLIKTPTNWAEWSKIFGDPQIWQLILIEICKKTGITPALPFAAGYPGTCAVFAVEREFVIKIFPPFLPGDYSHELSAYRLLGDRLDPFLPKLASFGIIEDEINWPYLVLEYREGPPLREIIDDTQQQNLNSIGKELGNILKRLHSTPLLPGESSFDIRRESWQEFIQNRQAHCRAEIEQKTNFSTRLLDSIEQFVYSYPVLSETNEPSKLLNGDLTEDHLLLVWRDGEWQIDALIDWADSLVGDVEYEWVPLWFGLCQRKPEFFSAIMRSYDPTLIFDERFQRRMTAYTFIHQFGADIIAYWLARTSPGTIDTLPELMAWLWPVVPA